MANGATRDDDDMIKAKESMFICIVPRALIKSGTHDNSKQAVCQKTQHTTYISHML